MTTNYAPSHFSAGGALQRAHSFVDERKVDLVLYTCSLTGKQHWQRTARGLYDLSIVREERTWKGFLGKQTYTWTEPPKPWDVGSYEHYPQPQSKRLKLN